MNITIQIIPRKNRLQGTISTTPTLQSETKSIKRERERERGTRRDRNQQINGEMCLVKHQGTQNSEYAHTRTHARALDICRSCLKCVGASTYIVVELILHIMIISI